MCPADLTAPRHVTGVFGTICKVRVRLVFWGALVCVSGFSTSQVAATARSPVCGRWAPAALGCSALSYTGHAGRGWFHRPRRATRVSPGHTGVHRRTDTVPTAAQAPAEGDSGSKAGQRSAEETGTQPRRHFPPIAFPQLAMPSATASAFVQALAVTSRRGLQCQAWPSAELHVTLGLDECPPGRGTSRLPP